jgi:hypothetical protein
MRDTTTLLGEARDYLCELRGEWRWKRGEHRDGNDAQYMELIDLIARVTAALDNEDHSETK